MRHFRWTRWCLGLGVSALAACSPESPIAPRLHSITGHLRLTGYLVDVDGQFLGTRVIGNAGGVLVELLHGSEVVARTTTVDGIYRFSGLRPGDYVARSRPIGDLGDQTNPLVIAVSDVSAADTLRLVSRGDLSAVPNPSVDTTKVFFQVTDTVWVDVNILDMGGHAVTNLLALEILPARHAVFWNGRDLRGRLVTDSLYWVTFVAGQDVRAHLIFRR